MNASMRIVPIASNRFPPATDPRHDDATLLRPLHSPAISAVLGPLYVSIEPAFIGWLSTGSWPGGGPKPRKDNGGGTRPPVLLRLRPWKPGCSRPNLGIAGGMAADSSEASRWWFALLWLDGCDWFDAADTLAAGGGWER